LTGILHGMSVSAEDRAAALFGCVCYMLTGQPLGAGVTIAMVGMALLLQFPTSDRLDAWLDRSP